MPRKVNDENEPDQSNPFSGPIYNPSNIFKGNTSPLVQTPIKPKEEFIGDYNDGNKEYGHFSRAFESPYTSFCKDLSLSPGGFLSPSTHQIKSKYHNFGYLLIFINVLI